MSAGEPVTRTFLFTDLEGSTRLWEDEPDLMPKALARHDEILRTLIETNGGSVFSTAGDSFAAAFANAVDAVRVAVEGQRALASEQWPGARPLRARMGLHTDVAHCRDDNYFGAGLNRCARLMSAAHGGQVVCSEATAALIRDATVGTITLVDLGEHRLRDLSRPLRVFQLNDPDAPGEFPSLRSLDAFPTNLPAQLATFVGRTAELRATTDALQTSRLVTLTGVGGVGKTRVALQTAADLLPRYVDGAWLVELGGVADAFAVEEAIAAALGVQEQPGQSLHESVLAFLAGKRLLMVLDNCEHLLEPVADLVETALARAPKLAVLATSREALGVSGERVLGVPSLSLPAIDDPGGLAITDAVALFLDRARSARSDFVLTGDNGTAIAHLCRRLDGIPLAIELAAARVRSMAPAEIAARLDQRFRLLTGGTRRAANRHQTLRRAIDWSWELLADDDRALFRRLAVCVGGFDLAAAENIGAGGGIDAFDVDDLLGRLVEKSLIVAEDQGETTRYRMLETIREYVLERLEEAGEVDEARERHALYYADFAEDAGKGLKTAAEQVWLERAEGDLDNLRLAVAWSIDASQSAVALRIVTALSIKGIQIETSVGTWAEAAITAEGASDDFRYPAVLGCVAWTAMRQGNTERAIALGQRALALSSSETPEQARVRMQVIGTTAGTLGYLQQAESEQLVDEWVQVARRLDDPYEEALAEAINCLNRYFLGADGGVEAGERAVEAARRSGCPSATSYALTTLAIAIDLSHPERALALLDESVECAEAVNNRFAAVVANSTRGALLIRAGDLVAGLRASLDAASRGHHDGNRAQQVSGLWQVSYVLAIMQNDEPAATIDAWARGVFGGQMVGGLLAIATSAREALDQLPSRLGEQRHAEIARRGAAMDDDEIMQFAHAVVDAVTSTR